ncbi:LLM class F420-dependent oxidoreductase [soil metagenome]
MTTNRLLPGRLSRVRTDLVLSPFGAGTDEMLAAARMADAGGFDRVWTFDHVSGGLAGRSWSRDPFTMMGAIAATTKRVGVGVLVANMMNRHPAQLALAVNTLQALAPGRVACGLGAGAAPGSRFAREHVAMGVVLGGAEARSRRLVETIACLGAVWRGETFIGDDVVVNGLTGVIDGAPLPPIIVGAASASLVRVATAHADGVNLRRGPSLPALVELARHLAPGSDFEVSVFDRLDTDHPEGGDIEPLADLGVNHRTLAVSSPYPFAAIERVATTVS